MHPVETVLGVGPALEDLERIGGGSREYCRYDTEEGQYRQSEGRGQT